MLTGPISTVLSGIPLLKELRVNNNFLTGTLPDHFASTHIEAPPPPPPIPRNCDGHQPNSEVPYRFPNTASQTPGPVDLLPTGVALQDLKQSATTHPPPPSQTYKTKNTLSSIPWPACESIQAPMPPSSFKNEDIKRERNRQTNKPTRKQAIVVPGKQTRNFFMARPGGNGAIAQIFNNMACIDLAHSP
jgi:hypothetical protein